MRERQSRTPEAARGFTLIELMITVAILAVLASIAYPAYTGSILKGRRAEGRTALMSLMQQQERYLTQTGSYLTFTAAATGGNGTTKDASGVTIPFKTVSGDSSGGAYQLAAAACTGLALNECVSLTAVPLRSDPDAGTLSLTSTGAKSCNGTKASVKGVCW